MAKKQAYYKRNFKLFIPYFIAIGLLAGITVGYVVLGSRIYPNVSISNVPVGGMTVSQASEAIKQSLYYPNEIHFIVESRAINEPKEFKLELKDIDFKYDIDDTIISSYSVGREGNPLQKAGSFFIHLFKNSDIKLQYQYDKDKLNNYISGIAGQLESPATDPQIRYTNGNITVSKGTSGLEVDTNKLNSSIDMFFSSPLPTSIVIPIVHINNTLSDNEVELAKTRAENLLNKKLQLTFENNNYEYSNDKLITLLDPRGDYNSERINSLINELIPKVNREPQDAVFEFISGNDGGKVNEFKPAKDGIQIVSSDLSQKIYDGITALETKEDSTVSISIPVVSTKPKITMSEVNNLGITELIGRGTSTYKHSIPSRVHNVALATSKVNGALIAPGETFSFNNLIGDISKYTGYKEAYIIQDGKTVLGDGGGVCQVSTTLFRAVLNAGLPIVERRAHAYRVSYYEQDSPPGLDATIFTPTTDFKFKNDTEHHILIQAKADSKNLALTFELYGTSDGRKASITKPVIASQSPPPPDLYIDDPTLAAGVVKQIDYKAWGAKVTFDYTVTRDGQEVYKKTFISSYKPWQAKYLRGVGPTQ